MIGRGGFGKVRVILNIIHSKFLQKVWKVEQKKNKQVFALKEMSKCKYKKKTSIIFLKIIGNLKGLSQSVV